MNRKLKKISVLLVLMLTLAVCFAFGASAEETTYTEGYYTYTVTDDKATITAVDTAISGDITTPTTLGGYPVTVIGESAFYKCSNITSIIVSEGVEKIGESAFASCEALTNISLPDSLTALDGQTLFTYSKIKEITIPKNVSYIEPGACFGTAIERIIVDEENPCYSTDEHGVLFNEDKTTLIAWPSMCSEVNYTVPDTVKKIEFGAFGYATRLEGITLPEGLEEIGGGAFAVTSIKNFHIPASVSQIGFSALTYCMDLEKITVDENNSYFAADENGVLYSKDKTTLRIYPAGRKDSAFEIPENVTTIYADAFEWPIHLRKVVFNNDFEIVQDTDYSPQHLLSFHTLEEIVFKAGVTEIPEYTFNTMGFSKDIYVEGFDTTLPEKSNIATWVTCGYIEVENFAQRYLAYIKMVYGGEYTEAECDSYYDENIEPYMSFSDSSYIYGNIYCHEGSATYTYAQENSINYRCEHFYKDGSEWVLDFDTNTATRECLYCTVTEDIYEYSVTDGEAKINGVTSVLHGDVYIPETIDGYPLTKIGYMSGEYDNLYIHKDIKEISEDAFEMPGSGNIIVDENNPCFVVEDGALYDIDKKRLIKYFDINERTYFEILESVVSIDGYAFAGAAYLEEIKLNEGLKEIGDYAFSYTNINNIEFPSTLETIGEGVFTICPMFKEFTVPASVKTIGDYAFMTYFPVDIYFEGTDIIFSEWEIFGLAEFEMDCTREEFAEFLIYAAEVKFSDEAGDAFEDYIKYLDAPVKQHKIYCHEGANFIEQMDATATEYGVENLYEYTHFFKDWTYDWEGLERTAKCLHCDETSTESLRTAEDNEIEFIAPADDETTFVVETVEDESSDNFVLVVEALETYEGSAAVEKIFDITLENSEGVAVQPDGSVQVKLPVAETHGNYKVFRVNDDGTYTDMNATVVDGYVVFVTDHFSLYVIVDTTEAHEHSYTSEVTKAATHLEEGIKTYTCDCGDSYTEVIEKVATHQWNLTYTAPTCTEDGYDLAKCACGDEFIYKTYGALNHNYSYELTLAATHLKDGLETYTCSRCGDSYTNVLPKIEKHYYGWRTVKVEPTCTEKGYTVHKCECGDSYTDSYVDATGHIRSASGVGCKICGVDLEPEKKDCDHMCHEGGFMGFIWKIVQFFWKLFKMNPVCECGAEHY